MLRGRLTRRKSCGNEWRERGKHRSAGCDSNVPPEDPSSSLGEIIAHRATPSSIKRTTNRSPIAPFSLFRNRMFPAGCGGETARGAQSDDPSRWIENLPFTNNLYGARLFPLLPAPPLLREGGGRGDISRSDFSADSFRCHVAARRGEDAEDARIHKIRSSISSSTSLPPSCRPVPLWPR